MGSRDAKTVLMVADSLIGGGAERQLTLLASALSDPWQAKVFSLRGGLYADKLRDAGVPLTIAPRRFRFDISPTKHLWQVIADSAPAVVHSWGWMTCCAAEIFCRPRRIPHVAGVIRRGRHYKLKGRLPQMASRLGDLTLANSRAGLEAFGISSERGRVLHNGFDPERLARVVPAEPPSSPFHVVMAATMDDRKDFPTLITAMRRLRDMNIRPVKATLLGGGPLLESWRAAAPDLIADGTVSFPGQVNEILDYLADAHVGVLLAVPGWGEGISNSIMEYMAASLPVICTDSGGNPELVENGRTGLLLAPSDVDGLVSALVHLAENQEEAKAMGQAGRRRIETDFSVETMLRRAVTIYEEAIARKER